MKNKRIYCKTKLKYLGLIINDRLKWDDYIKETVDKTIKTIFKLKNNCRQLRSTDNKSMPTIYNAAIRPTVIICS